MRLRLETDRIAIDIEDGRIVGQTAQRPAITMSVPGGVLRPGLINAHDHLHRNHYPRLGRPPYRDAYEWGHDIHRHDADDIAAARALPRATALLFGAFRNLIAGVTCVVHHDTREDELDCGFPLRVPHVRTAHSPGFDRAGMARLAAEVRSAPGPFAIHVAEGVTAEATAEIHTIAEAGLLRPELLAVHCTAARTEDARKLARAGAAIVWCPSSNLHLFGRTCAREVLDSCAVLLGTDSLLTADGTMLDELAVARRLGHLSADRLEAAVGALAAARLGLKPVALEAGSPADLVLLRQQLADASVADVALVLVGGRPRVADEELGDVFSAMGEPAECLRIGGVQKLVSRPLAESAFAVFDAWPDAARIIAT